MVYFAAGRPIHNRLWRGGVVQLWGSPNELMNQLVTEVFVEQPLTLPGYAKYWAKGPKDKRTKGQKDQRTKGPKDKMTNNIGTKGQTNKRTKG